MNASVKASVLKSAVKALAFLIAEICIASSEPSIFQAMFGHLTDNFTVAQIRIFENLFLLMLCLPLIWLMFLLPRVRQLKYIRQLLVLSREAEAETALAANIFSVAMEAIVVMDAKTHVLSVNAAFTQITGYTADEILGRRSAAFQTDLENPHFHAAMWNNIRLLDRWQGQLWRRRKNGEPFLTWQSVRVLRDEAGAVTRYVTVFSDISELHQKNEQIRHQALHDALTGLPNRVLLKDRLEHSIELARRSGGRVAVLFIDLDHFKEINDSYGHDMGDQLLLAVTQRLQSGLRQSDTVARLGGDEFVVALTRIDDLDEVETVAAMIRAVLLEAVELGGHSVQIGASIGAAVFPDHGGHYGELMRKADIAMYQAKEAGRNCFCLFDEKYNEQKKRNSKIETVLRRALELSEFEVYYQPRFELASGRLCGAEALLRWNSPTRGLLLPGAFLRDAEETGVMQPLGEWVLESVCRQMAEWDRRGLPPIPIAVNVSCTQMGELLVERIRSILAKHALLPGRLEIDIASGAVMSQGEARGIDILSQLSQNGIRVALADFADTCFYLRDLTQLPVDAIKISQVFVRELGNDAEKTRVVEAIMRIAQSMGLAIMAEGVETDEEERYLQQMNCGYVQGFKYGRPQPVARFERWIERALQVA